MIIQQTKPIFQQIADHVCEEILVGRYPVGTRVPSAREYAATLQVNYNTVARAFERLQQSDIIVKERGIGFFVANDAIDAIRKARVEQFKVDFLPALFRQMRLLNITIDDVVNLYEDFNSKGTAALNNK